MKIKKPGFLEKPGFLLIQILNFNFLVNIYFDLRRRIKARAATELKPIILPGSGTFAACTKSREELCLAITLKSGP